MSRTVALAILLLATAVAFAANWQKSKLVDFQGDLMIWAPEVGCSPEANIRCDAAGLKAGWVWSLTIPRYNTANRAKLYDAVKRRGYTHVAVRVTRCQVGGGYHDLYPETAATCATDVERTNRVLRELHARNLIPVCAGVAPADPIAPGIDKSLCPIAMTDWDNSDQADCRIKAVAETFPNALVYYELLDGPVAPKQDECSGGPISESAGGAWILRVRQKYPNFTGVLYEINRPEGIERNVKQLEKLNAFWRDTQQVLFETDTYWKFWDNVGEAAAIRDNDALLARAPWLKGYMSGATPHAAVESGR